MAILPVVYWVCLILFATSSLLAFLVRSRQMSFAVDMTAEALNCCSSVRTGADRGRFIVKRCIEPSSLEIPLLHQGRYGELLHLQMQADEKAAADQAMGTVVKGIEGSRSNSVRATPAMELATAYQLPSGAVKTATSAGIKADSSSGTSGKPRPASFRRAEVEAAKEGARLAARKQIGDGKDVQPQRPESAVGAAIAAAGGKQSAGPLLQDANAAADAAATKPAVQAPRPEKAAEKAELEAELLSELLSDQEDGGDGGGSGNTGGDPKSAAVLQRSAGEQGVADSSGGKGGPTFWLSPPRLRPRGRRGTSSIRAAPPC